MTRETSKHHRSSIRLTEYDYSRAGAYFMTISAHQRECLFGEIHEGTMRPNAFGEIVEEEWLKTGNLRLTLVLDAFTIMPNHVHAIVILQNPNEARRGTARRAPMFERFGRPVSGSLPTIVRSFKSAVTRRINQLRCMPGERIWQRGYYEHVIRNENALGKIREYITGNPLQWESDHENPLAAGMAKKEPWEI